MSATDFRKDVMRRLLCYPHGLTAAELLDSFPARDRWLAAPAIDELIHRNLVLRARLTQGTDLAALDHERLVVLKNKGEMR